MTFKEFSSTIKSSMQQYASAGLIGDLKIYDYMLEGLSAVGTLPAIRIETVLDVKNNKARLPDGFKSIYKALKCEPYKMTSDCTEPRDILQNSYFYSVKEIDENKWNICDPCEVQEKETCVVEKIYFRDNRRADLYYNNVQPLRLRVTPHVRRSRCDRDCVNLRVKNSPWEISINNKYLYTNFASGNIFLVYNGYEEDEEGYVMIVETPENNLYKYLKAYVIRELIKEMFLNSDNTTNEQFLYTLYDQEVQKYLPRATGELKLNKVLQTMPRYKASIRREFELNGF